MIVNVLHKCGHSAEHNFKGKNYNLPAWLFKCSEEDCPDCQCFKLTKEAEQKGLPLLLGSTQQKVWALTIRNEVMMNYNLMKKEFDKKGTKKERKKELFLMLLKIKNLIMSETEAAFWIAHKTIRALLKYKKVKTIRRTAQKPIEETDYKMNFDDDNIFDIFEGNYENRLKSNLSYLC